MVDWLADNWWWVAMLVGLVWLGWRFFYWITDSFRKMNQTMELLPRLVPPEGISGRRLRSSLRCRGIKLSVVQFYAIMARMEDEGRVRGYYETVYVEDRFVRRKHFKPAGTI